VGVRFSPGAPKGRIFMILLEVIALATTIIAIVIVLIDQICLAEQTPKRKEDYKWAEHPKKITDMTEYKVGQKSTNEELDKHYRNYFSEKVK
jgi:hypothetical protein